MVVKKLHTTRRFGVMAAVSRRKCSADLEVCLPPEVQCKPPLRQAAVPLGASGQRKSQEQLKIIEENFCLFPKITIFAE
jgi:hypothetical protein